MLKLPTTLVKGGLRSITGYSGFVDAVMSVFIFAFVLGCSLSTLSVLLSLFVALDLNFKVGLTRKWAKAIIGWAKAEFIFFCYKSSTTNALFNTLFF